jgi:hypothetical protein
MVPLRPLWPGAVPGGQGAAGPGGYSYVPPAPRPALQEPGSLACPWQRVGPPESSVRDFAGLPHRPRHAHCAAPTSNVPGGSFSWPLLPVFGAACRRRARGLASMAAAVAAVPGGLLGLESNRLQRLRECRSWWTEFSVRAVAVAAWCFGARVPGREYDFCGPPSSLSVEASH